MPVVEYRQVVQRGIDRDAPIADVEPGRWLEHDLIVREFDSLVDAVPRQADGIRYEFHDLPRDELIDQLRDVLCDLDCLAREPHQIGPISIRSATPDDCTSSIPRWQSALLWYDSAESATMFPLGVRSRHRH